MVIDVARGGVRHQDGELGGRGEDDRGDGVAEQDLGGVGEAGQQRAAVQADFAAGQRQRWFDGEDDRRFWILAHRVVPCYFTMPKCSKSCRTRKP